MNDLQIKGHTHLNGLGFQRGKLNILYVITESRIKKFDTFCSKLSNASDLISQYHLLTPSHNLTNKNMDLRK